jgi:hypothetical protein
MKDTSQQHLIAPLPLVYLPISLAQCTFVKFEMRDYQGIPERAPGIPWDGLREFGSSTSPPPPDQEAGNPKKEGRAIGEEAGRER